MPIYKKEERENAYSSLKFYSDYCGSFIRLGIIVYITYSQFDILKEYAISEFQYRFFYVSTIFVLAALYGPLAFYILKFNYQTVLFILGKIFQSKLRLLAFLISVCISVFITFVIFYAISGFIEKR